MLVINPYVFGIVPETPSYANPGGTGNRSGIITVTANFAPGSGVVGNLVDGDKVANNSTNSIQLPAGTLGGEIQFDFGASVFKEISEFRWNQSATNTHGSWVLEGSNDLTLWYRAAGAITLGGSSGDNTYSAAQVIDGFRYWRLRHLVDTINSVVWVREVEFLIRNIAQHTDTPSVASYDNVGGRGPRTSLITMSTSFSTNDGSIDKLVDGGFTGNGSWSWRPTQNQSSGFVKWDFGARSPIITEMAFTQSLSQNHNQWDFEGSNDNSVWTPILTNFNISGTGPLLIDLSANTTAYRYYRLNKPSGAGYGNLSLSLSYWTEIEFKLKY
jgi:hypothetical protein